MYHRAHWSYSAISQYLSCPLRYYFQRVLRLPQKNINSSLVLGSAVHAALAAYHRDIRDEHPIDPGKLQRILVETWDKKEPEIPVTYRPGETKSELIAQGISLLELYLKDPPPEQIVAVEQEIISPIHTSCGTILEAPLVAVVDLIIQGKENLVIREFKTSARAYSEGEAETSLQPTCYINAVQESYGQAALLEYTVLIKTKTPKIQRLTTVRNEEDLGRLGDIVQGVERGIKTQVFYPVETPLNCSTCPYRQPCREWPRLKPVEILELQINSYEKLAC